MRLPMFLYFATQLFMRKTVILLTSILLSVLAFAGFASTSAEVVSRTETATFWRYNFRYETTDVDGKTPIVLSAAIFMSRQVHDKEYKAPGCAILNHYTITGNREAPTNVYGIFSFESFLQQSNYFIVESDGIGFGITFKRSQPYLSGRVTARNNIDAFIAARSLLAAEGFEFGDIVLNLGYSQGGHSGMWVSRLVEEGYRAEELPRIDLAMLGGGPYDLQATYNQIVDSQNSLYPVAIPLIVGGYLSSEGANAKYEDFFLPDFVMRLPQWFESKESSSGELNGQICYAFGGSRENGVAVSSFVSADFLNRNSDLMRRMSAWLDENSLVSSAWCPSKTERMAFVHSRIDEVVPYINMESLAGFLSANGYDNFAVIDNSERSHTQTGMMYVMAVLQQLETYQPMRLAAANIDYHNSPQLFDVEDAEGNQVMSGVNVAEIYQSLPSGEYSINGFPFYK